MCAAGSFHTVVQITVFGREKRNQSLENHYCEPFILKPMNYLKNLKTSPEPRPCLNVKCYIKPREEPTNKIHFVPFQPVTCLNSKLGMNKWEFSRPDCVRCHVLVQPRLDVFAGKNSLREAGQQSRQRTQLGELRGPITCIQTHRYAVWCCQTGSVWGSCTCLALPARSLRGGCHSPFSCSHPERWPTLSSKPGEEAPH